MKATLGSITQSVIFGIRILFLLGLIGVVIVGTFFYLPANVHYHVTERYLFSGVGKDALVYLGVMLPKSGPYQSVRNVEIAWGGAQREESYDFVDVIKLSGKMIEKEKLEATIEYDVRLPQGNVSWSAPVEKFQHLPQTGIESDCLCFQEQAENLCDGITENDAYEIFSFTADYLTYSRESEDCTSMSAIQAYHIGSCVCAGYARLMTALCRASGIPSQMVLGLVYPDPMFKSHITSFPQNPNEAHAWVEYYAEGNWNMADPTWGAKRSKFLQFNRNDGRHLVYGELDQILSIDKEVEMWAFGQAKFLLGDVSSFRYTATSDSNQILFLPVVSIQRRWDGRWVNTLVAWGIITWLLSRYRSQFIGFPRPKTKQ